MFSLLLAVCLIIPAGFCVSLILGDCLCCAPVEESGPDDCSCCQQKMPRETREQRSDCFTFSCGCPGAMAGTLPLELTRRSVYGIGHPMVDGPGLSAGKDLTRPLIQETPPAFPPGFRDLFSTGKLFILQGVLLI